MNNDDTKEAKGLCGDLTAKLKCQKKPIKMADRSVVGWDTVAEYEAGPIAKIQSDKPKTGNLPKEKLKHLTNLPFPFPVRNHQGNSFELMVSITTSHPRVNKTSASDFHRAVLPRTTTINARDGPVAQMPDQGHVLWLW